MPTVGNNVQHQLTNNRSHTTMWMINRQWWLWGSHAISCIVHTSWRLGWFAVVYVDNKNQKAKTSNKRLLDLPTPKG